MIIYFLDGQNPNFLLEVISGSEDVPYCHIKKRHLEEEEEEEVLDESEFKSDSISIGTCNKEFFNFCSMSYNSCYICSSILDLTQNNLSRV